MRTRRLIGRRAARRECLTWCAVGTLVLALPLVAWLGIAAQCARPFACT